MDILDVVLTLISFLGSLFIIIAVVGMIIFGKRIAYGGPDPRKGAVAIVEAWNGRRKNFDIRGRRIHAYDKTTLKPVLLGKATSLRSGQSRIELFGTWKRVDENAIKATVSFVTDRDDEMSFRGVTEYILRVGEEFPTLRRIGSGNNRVMIENPPTYIKVLHLYVPEDSPPK